MHRATSGTAWVISLVLLSPLVAVAAPLSGHMAAMNSMLGATWACTTNVPAMGSRPAMTDRAQVSFESVSGNVLHVRIASPAYAADQYIGYDDRSAKWWMNSADNDGTTSFQTSSDGRSYVGMSGGSRPAAPMTTTFTLVSPNETRIHEVDGTGPASVAIDTVCMH